VTIAGHRGGQRVAALPRPRPGPACREGGGGARRVEEVEGDAGKEKE
jgi:hypothetical protein